MTHFHPDHVGAAADVRDLTGAPVLQGELDLEQCRLVWGADASDRPSRGVVRPGGRSLRSSRESSSSRARGGRPFIRYADDATRRRGRRPGRRLGARRGAGARRRPADAAARRRPDRRRPRARSDHAGGRALAGVRPDPLGDYLGALADRRRARAADRATAGTASRSSIPHVAPRRSSPIIDERLDGDRGRALGDGPRTGYEVSFALFGGGARSRCPRASPSPRRCPTSSDSSWRAVPSAREDVGVVTYTARLSWTASYRPVPAPRTAGRPFLPHPDVR